ncbi:hypothetical protein FHG87_011686 [Trinorchestia longiramus]|nr:hypothetical protein FHG87_011686 [Trinorchestia longiramus]
MDRENSRQRSQKVITSKEGTAYTRERERDRERDRERERERERESERAVVKSTRTAVLDPSRAIEGNTAPHKLPQIAGINLEQSERSDGLMVTASTPVLKSVALTDRVRLRAYILLMDQFGDLFTTCCASEEEDENLSNWRHHVTL